MRRNCERLSKWEADEGVGGSGGVEKEEWVERGGRVINNGSTFQREYYMMILSAIKIQLEYIDISTSSARRSFLTVPLAVSKAGLPN